MQRRKIDKVKSNSSRQPKLTTRAQVEPEQKLFTGRLVLIWCYVQAEHAVNAE